MDQQSGKVKFGFAKVIKKPNLVNQNGQSSIKVNKIELIEAIEGSSLKIIGKDPNDELEKKLIIPMTNDQRTTPLSKLLEERKKNIKNKTIKTEPMETNETPVEVKIEIPIDETLEQQAARELIEDLQNKLVKSEVKVFEVPINPDELPLEGAKESSLDDYDRVPIGDFGKAMLRGMGWKEEEKKESSLKEDLDGPILRPKGMGLGADKVIKKQALLIAPLQSETLEVKRNACIKVLAGKHKNMYGTIEGFDDGGGRVIVKLAIGGLKVTMNEFMVQPIAKQEFAKYGKILNSEKFDEYNTTGAVKTSSIKVENDDRKPQRERSRDRERRRTRERSASRDRKPSNKSSDRRRDADRIEYSSTSKYRGRSRSRSRSRDKRSKRNSSSSDDHKHKKKSSSKHKKHYSSPDSRYSSENEKKHKKKTKRSKKKRDRS